jgi:CBS domain-containing protein
VLPEQQHYVVVSEPHRLAGIISLPEIRHVPESRRKEMLLKNLVQPHPPVAWPHEHLDDVLERMADHNVSVIPVIDHETGELLGSVTSSDVLSLITGVRKADAK